MLLIKGQNVKKSYGDRTIFSIEQFSVYDQDRIGIVGLNGSGKSTLLKVLADEIHADEGIIDRYGHTAYIPQLEDVNESIIDNLGNTTFFSKTNSKDSSALSGGEMTRLKIDQALNSRAPILLADEPTSHLDLDGIEKLEKALKNYKGAVILISHDKTLLNHVCNLILEVEDGKVSFYKGNYNDYEREKRNEKQLLAFEYEQYIKEKERLLSAAEDKKEKSNQMKKAPSRMGNSEARLHKGSTRQKKGKVSEQSTRIMKRLEMLEEKEKPKDELQVTFDLNYFHTLHAKYAVQADRLSFAYSKKQLFHDISFMLPTGSRLAMIGNNGTGKTTLAKLIDQRTHEQLEVAGAARIGYYTQDISQLDTSLTILEEIKKDSPYPETFIRTICARLLFKGEAVFKLIGDLSGGEKAKVALAKVFLGDYNLLLLDEPTNYLDIYTKNELSQILKAYPGTLVFISHDRDFITSLADHLLIFQNQTAEYFRSNYKEYNQRQNQNNSSEPHRDAMLLDMEMTSVLSQLSTAIKQEEKDLLEKRYNELLQLKKRS